MQAQHPASFRGNAASIVDPPTGGLGALWRSWFGSPQSKQSGQPVPLGADEHRSPPFRNVPLFGRNFYTAIPDYDWGSARYRFVPGQPYNNPIGAGIVPGRMPPVLADVLPTYFGSLGAAARWNSQMINGGAGPTVSPILTSAQLAQLMSPLSLQAVVPTQAGNW